MLVTGRLIDPPRRLMGTSTGRAQTELDAAIGRKASAIVSRARRQFGRKAMFYQQQSMALSGATNTPPAIMARNMNGGRPSGA